MGRLTHSHPLVSSHPGFYGSGGCGTAKMSLCFPSTCFGYRRPQRSLACTGMGVLHGDAGLPQAEMPILHHQEPVSVPHPQQ